MGDPLVNLELPDEVLIVQHDEHPHGKVGELVEHQDEQRLDGGRRRDHEGRADARGARSAAPKYRQKRAGSSSCASSDSHASAQPSSTWRAAAALAVAFPNPDGALTSASGALAASLSFMLRLRRATRCGRGAGA